MAACRTGPGAHLLLTGPALGSAPAGRRPATAPPTHSGFRPENLGSRAPCWERGSECSATLSLQESDLGNARLLGGGQDWTASTIGVEDPLSRRGCLVSAPAGRRTGTARSAHQACKNCTWAHNRAPAGRRRTGTGRPAQSGVEDPLLRTQVSGQHTCWEEDRDCTASTPVLAGTAGAQIWATQCMCSGVYLSILHAPGLVRPPAVGSCQALGPPTGASAWPAAAMRAGLTAVSWTGD